MESNNQKTNIANWYTQNSEHYIASFGEEYEQHFTEEKNTDGGCAILTNQHCYLQGNYLLEPEKKSKSCFTDEKISLHNVMKCGIRHSPSSVLMVCILFMVLFISIYIVYIASDYLNDLYSYKQEYEFRLSKQPLKMYEKKVDEYNQMVNAVKNDITENGANASCVYFLSESQSMRDIVEQYEASEITGLRIYVRQYEGDYFHGALTGVYSISEFHLGRFGGYTELVLEATWSGENIWGTYVYVDIDSEHQIQLNKIFSNPETLFNELEYNFEPLYIEYLCEYFEDEFGIWLYDVTDFEGLEWKLTSYEKNLRNAIDNWLEPLPLCACIIFIILVIVITVLIFKLLGAKFFYLVYRTDTLDYKELYLLLKKELYNDVELFSSKLKKAKNTKESRLFVTETANQRSPENPSINSQPDDLRKYAELLRDGVITQEEFDAMKQKILGL